MKIEIPYRTVRILSPFLSTNSFRPAVCGIGVRSGVAYATDGAVMIVARSPSIRVEGADDRTVVLDPSGLRAVKVSPRDAASAVVSIETDTALGAIARIMIGASVGASVPVEFIDAEYPDVSGIIRDVDGSAGNAIARFDAEYIALAATAAVAIAAHAIR